MKGHIHKGIWLTAIIVVIAFHGTILYYITSRVVLTTVVISVLTMVVLKLIVIKRWELRRSLHALFRRQSRH